MDKDWFWLNCYTYVKLADSVDVTSLEKRFNDPFSYVPQAMSSNTGDVRQPADTNLGN